MAACFGTDSNQDLNLFACDPDGDLKSCCSRGDSCASNGLCVTSNSEALTPYFINGCTNQNWNDPTCLKQCMDSGGVGVSSCGKGKYCCYGLGGCDCDDEDEVFTLDPVSIVASIPSDATRIPAATSTITTAAHTSTTQTSPAQTSTASDNDSSHESTTIGLGVGLGVGIPLILAAVGLIWFFKRRKGAQTSNVAYQGPMKKTNYGGYYTSELDDRRNERAELP